MKLFLLISNPELFFFQGCMLFDQIIGTWILCMTVQSVADARNNYGSIAPLIIGWSATGVGMSFGSGAG